jgi:hypothetical protein
MDSSPTAHPRFITTAVPTARKTLTSIPLGAGAGRTRWCCCRHPQIQQGPLKKQALWTAYTCRRQVSGNRSGMDTQNLSGHGLVGPIETACHITSGLDLPLFMQLLSPCPAPCGLWHYCPQFVCECTVGVKPPLSPQFVGERPGGPCPPLRFKIERTGGQSTPPWLFGCPQTPPPRPPVPEKKHCRPKLWGR